MKFRRKHLYFGLAAFGLVTYYAFLLLPHQLFHSPYSTLIEDRAGNLLGATIADDGQWRFPPQDSVPEKYRIAVVAFEDRRFASHAGVDPLALARAVRQNLEAGQVISGGSTLTMQVVKLSRRQQPRTYFEKARELLMATRLEWRCNKNEILALYSAHAPFGGNVVGIEAACWRYFGHRPADLSWAEAALLAVLPNNPSLLRPGKNHALLKARRDHLLDRLAADGHFDLTALSLAKSEGIPHQPLTLPRLAPHLLDRAMQEGLAQTRVQSTLDGALQRRALDIIARQSERLRGNQINNAAAMIVEVKSGRVLAYVGNSPSGAAHQEQVDVLRSKRSTGSILKPFLYAAALDEGTLLPQSLVPDIPSVINGFAPKNYSHTYDGAVPFNTALIRSLNVPFVLALHDYRYEKFYDLLKKAGLTTLTQPADHYGLTLILGGAEATPWDIAGVYGAIAFELNYHARTPLAIRDENLQFNMSYLKDPIPSKGPTSSFKAPPSAAALWQTIEALKELSRPGEESGWKSFESSKPIAWKTGTSFGFRDGWAAGATPRYVVVVWTGNADGEGRPGLIGSETAAPILFELFGQLPGQDWFEPPLDEMEFISVCAQSGQRTSDFCQRSDSVWVTRAGLRSPPCRYHKVIYLSEDGKSRVNASCAVAEDRIARNWFVLPPVQEYFYKAKNITYKSVPALRPGCPDPATLATMDLVYPKNNARIFLPRELDGSKGATVFQVAHRTARTRIFWHLDGDYLGSTTRNHTMMLAPSPGAHTLSLVDESGQYLTRMFEVIASPN